MRQTNCGMSIECQIKERKPAAPVFRALFVLSANI